MRKAGENYGGMVHLRLRYVCFYFFTLRSLFRGVLIFTLFVSISIVSLLSSFVVLISPALNMYCVVK